MDIAEERQKPQLQVVYRAIGDLKPDPRNARTHSKRQIQQIGRSITEFGFTNPILIDEHGNVIAGHGRLLAARQLGMAEVPTITIGGLTATQIRLLRLPTTRSRSMPAGMSISLRMSLATFRVWRSILAQPVSRPARSR